MYFKKRKVKGNTYRYAVKTIRLPNGKVASLERMYKGESQKALQDYFGQKEIGAFAQFALKAYGTDHIFNEQALQKIEQIRVEYRKVMRHIPATAQKGLLDRFTANFTYESNALEGNSLTLKDVAMVMFENASLKSKDLREIYEARNSRKVVELIMKNKLDVSHKDIKAMHKMLLKDILSGGSYKALPNIILGSPVETALPEHVFSRMEHLIRWYHTQKQHIHPLKLAALFHGKFEQIHPFDDGNGRVGRFLINTILIKNKYPPLIIRKSQRVSYLRALQAFDANHPDLLERLALQRFKETFEKFFQVYVKYL
ncbi:Fic family protein [Candidatus Woesearchaeota archaeon]|nr:Fic family protein [Candidatus Woesearchaeota archaeon]